MISNIFLPPQPYPVSETISGDTPRYFSEAVYERATEALGVKVVFHSFGYSDRSLRDVVGLSLRAFNALRTIKQGSAVIWQGHGVYAALLNQVTGGKTRFVLNTYKVPWGRPESLSRRINNALLARAIHGAIGVVVIARRQEEELRRHNANVVWVPFASDSDWWTPGLPDSSLLRQHDIGFDNYILVMGDVDRDEIATLRGLRGLKRPILRVTRDPQTALRAREAFSEEGIKEFKVLVNAPFKVLREIYRGAQVVVVPARNLQHPAGMTSMTEAMSCGKLVVIPAGLTTAGYVEDGHDAFVLQRWVAADIEERVAHACQQSVATSVGSNARNTVQRRLNFASAGRTLADFLSKVVLHR